MVEALKRSLLSKGYRVVYEGTRSGPDLVAYNDDRKELLIIEARGVPTKVKVKGRNKGKPKKEGTIMRQFWGWPAEVIAELMEREYEWLTRSASWVKHLPHVLGSTQRLTVRYVAVLGYDPKYVEVLEKRRHAILRLGYEVWLLDRQANIRYKIG